METNIEAVLAERGSRYGVFADQAKIGQSLQRVMRAAPAWERMQDDQRESLQIIANKIARILNGDPDYDDSWIDIAGYAKLVADRLRTK